MFDRILFPTDGSDGASAAFDHVLDIAADHGATVHVLNVADTTHDSVTRIDGEIVDVLEREGEEIVEAVADRAADRGIETVTKVLQGGVAETIATYAGEHEMDLVAMPTRGRTGFDRLLLGAPPSASSENRRCRCSVSDRTERRRGTPTGTFSCPPTGASAPPTPSTGR